MRVEVRRRTSALPYTMHGAHVMGLEAEGDRLTLLLDRGFQQRTEPGQVCAWAEFSGVYWEHSWLFLLDREEEGAFSGRRIALLDFVRQAGPVSITVVEESYGMGRVILSGVYSGEKGRQDCALEVCTKERVVYVTEEPYLPIQYKYDLR